MTKRGGQQQPSQGPDAEPVAEKIKQIKGVYSSKHKTKVNINSNPQTPFQPIINQKKKRVKYVPLTMEKIFAPLSWSRYISIELPQDQPISGIRIDKFLREYMDLPTPYFKIERNKIFVRAPSEDLSKKLMNLKLMENIPVKTSDKNDYNYREGTILVDLFRPGPEDTNEFLAAAIKEIFEIRHHKIESVEIYSRPNKFKTKQLKFAKIKFLQQDLPKEIMFGNMRIPIQEIFPKPMLCKRCLMFGYTYKRCRQELARCSRCSSPSHTKDLCTDLCKCYNCGENHDAFNFKCKHFSSRSANKDETVWSNLQTSSQGHEI